MPPSPGRRVLPAKKANTATPNKMIGRSVSNIDTRAAERARMRRRSQTEGVTQPSHASDVRPRPSRSASKVVHRGYMSQRKSYQFIMVCLKESAANQIQYRKSSSVIFVLALYVMIRTTDPFSPPPPPPPPLEKFKKRYISRRATASV